MKIKINFLNDQYVLINLFNNNAVCKWFDTFSSNADEYSVNLEDCPPLGYRKIDIDTEWNIIKDTFKDLQKFNFNPLINVADRFDKNQKTLNELHRFFTYNILWAQGLLEKNLANPYDKNFQFPASLNYSEWHSILDKINMAVHTLEVAVIRNSTMNVRSPEFTRRSIRKLKWLEFSKEEYIHNYEYFLKKTEHTNLVLLDRSILGKCPLQSFMDNDDPTADDCTGRFGSFGGFVIEVDDTRHQIYQSNEFKSWAHSYGLRAEAMPCDFPIGYILETNINDLSTTLTTRIIKNFINLEFIQE